MRVRYFAWVRERVGQAEEEIDLPPGIMSVADLIQYLAQKDEGYAAAFSEPDGDSRCYQPGARRTRHAVERGARDRVLSSHDGRIEGGAYRMTRGVEAT